MTSTSCSVIGACAGAGPASTAAPIATRPHVAEIQPCCCPPPCLVGDVTPPAPQRDRTTGLRGPQGRCAGGWSRCYAEEGQRVVRAGLDQTGGGRGPGLSCPPQLTPSLNSPSALQNRRTSSLSPSSSKLNSPDAPSSVPGLRADSLAQRVMHAPGCAGVRRGAPRSAARSRDADACVRAVCGPLDQEPALERRELAAEQPETPPG